MFVINLQRVRKAEKAKSHVEHEKQRERENHIPIDLESRKGKIDQFPRTNIIVSLFQPQVFSLMFFAPSLALHSAREIFDNIVALTMPVRPFSSNFD